MRSLLLLSVALLLVACMGPSAVKPTAASSLPTAAPISLNPGDWTIYTNGSSEESHPSPVSSPSGWFFAFGQSIATDDTYAQVVYTAPLTGKTNVSFTAAVTTTGSPAFQYMIDSDNTCIFPAHARAYLQRNNINWSIPTQRWWSDPIAFNLAPGTLTVTTPLAPSQWVDENGQFGNANAAAQAGFADVLQNIGQVGLSFGGGCFLGHGVYVTGGTATFTLETMTITP